MMYESVICGKGSKSDCEEESWIWCTLWTLRRANWHTALVKVRDDQSGDGPPRSLMDLRHDHGALIHVVRACDNADAPDLVAIGGENSVSVLLIVCATILLCTHVYIHPPSTRACYRPTRLQT